METLNRSLGSNARHLREQVRSIDSIRSERVAAGRLEAIRIETGSTGEKTPEQPIPETATPVGAEAPAIVQVGFKTLRLRPGMFLQAESTAKGAPRYDAQYLGIIEGKGVMVVPNGVLSLKHGMQAGENFVIRGFTGQYDFSFASSVIRIFDYSYRDPPLAYALLSYPETVEARQVRRALRVRASLPVTIWSSRGLSPVAATFIDLSVAGALINSPTPVGLIGDEKNLTFSIDFDNEKLDLVIPATICRSVKSESEDVYLTGFLFKNIARNDKLALYYFVQSSVESA
jgi:c-di-GMP-binding flagellar brake protein YcgR